MWICTQSQWMSGGRSSWKVWTTWTSNACCDNSNSVANRGRGGDGHGGNGGKGDGFHPSPTTFSVTDPLGVDSKKLDCGCHAMPLRLLCTWGKEIPEGIPSTAPAIPDSAMQIWTPSMFEQLQTACEKPPPREMKANSWISEATWLLIDNPSHGLKKGYAHPAGYEPMGVMDQSLT